MVDGIRASNADSPPHPVKSKAQPQSELVQNIKSFFSNPVQSAKNFFVRPIGNNGLPNSGNSCYLASAIELLFRIPGIDEEFLSKPLKRHRDPSSQTGTHRSTRR